VLDHFAIVVKSLVRDWGPKPFRSIDAWHQEVQEDGEGHMEFLLGEGK